MSEGFSFPEALQFLSERCPSLASDSDFADAMQQGTPGSILSYIQRVVLQPEFTLAVAVAFRPVLANVVSSAVDELASGRSRQAASPNALIALADVLSFAPYLHRTVLKGLAHVPSIESLLQLRNSASEGESTALLFAGLRLLKAAPSIHDSHLFAGLETLLFHKDREVRWATVECLALMHNLSDSAKQQLHAQLVGQEAGLKCALKWREDSTRVAVFGSAIWMPSPAHFGSKRRRLSPDSDTEMTPCQDSEALAAPPGFAAVSGILLPARDSALGSSSEGSSQLVMTPTVSRNLKAAALALCQQKPLLLEGPPGSGKSALIGELARRTGNVDYVTVHMDDQIDSKTLLGAYIATTKPGEFTWQPGLLTQAVVQGKWLLIEDINLAPPDVLAALALLLESRQLHISQRAEAIHAAEGFQLLATVTCSPGGSGVGAYGDSQGVRNLLGGLWMSVQLVPPPLSEQLDILTASFPALLPEVVAGCMAVLHLCQSVGGQPTSGQAAWAAVVEDATAAAGLRHGELAMHFGHHFSLRDLVKLCTRLQAGYPAVKSRRAEGVPPVLADVLKLPVSYRSGAFQECAGCFADMLASTEARHKLLLAIAFVWGFGADFLRDVTGSKPQLEVTSSSVSVGRARLAKVDASQAPAAAVRLASQQPRSFAQTGSVMRIMEAVAAAAAQNEAVLLVGETGTGKSTLVQHVANLAGTKMVALNLSQQTDSADLLGGFRPVQPAEAMLPLASSFQDLFAATFTRGDNAAFLARTAKLARRSKWGALLQAFKAAIAKVEALDERRQAEAVERHSDGQPLQPSPRKRKTFLSMGLRQRWQLFRRDVATATDMLAAAEGGVAFAFIEGALVKALTEGAWLLLDEINLAPPEALERIAGLLDGSSGSLVLSERGDATAVPRHPSFRLFAAMNPATDAGKRDLPAQLRQRFTEIYVPEMTAREDLRQLVHAYLKSAAPNPPVDAAVEFFLAARAEAERDLQDSAGSRPTYSLRALSRMLEYARAAAPTYGLQRALYDGGAMAFLTQLDAASAIVLERLLQTHLLGATRPSEVKAILNRVPPAPAGGRHILFEQFWVELGPQPLQEPNVSSFVATPSVARHLRNLARAVLLRSCPVLLQGPTSSGKTTLVSHLAACTGHRCVRINNHEGTDLQEYLGSYVTDEKGLLAFQEGALVTALRHGHWVILDELNLAPSEVLEALNRLLDDNRELFVPELQEVVRPHPHFMLFATQNPAGAYAGRKVMSRAFRSRFLELHVGDIPADELSTILHQRCAIAPSHAAKLVAVMLELQRRRQASNVFAGKHGLITPRDLFKWAGRGAISYEQLAANGYMLLAERLRLQEERDVVKGVLERNMNVKLDMGGLYLGDGSGPLPAVARKMQALRGSGALTEELEAQFAAVAGVVWTPSMQRMYTLLDRCLEHAEPALLVGDTGTGKTTACQLAALARGQRLRVLNCNRHTEASDFLGGYRPARDRQRHVATFQAALQAVAANPLLTHPDVPPVHKPTAMTAPELRAAANAAAAALAAAKKLAVSSTDQGSLDALAADVHQLAESAGAASAPFEWVDGPLVAAMREGDVILIDELNLAEDAVLERLNSVLEAGRSLTLAEKGGGGAEEVVAAPAFRLVATMNPGGDYGKRELSPALSNRFTTLWLPAFRDEAELRSILQAHVPDEGVRDAVVPRLLQFWAFFQQHGGIARAALSVRDLLAWAGFVTALSPSLGPLPAYAHGAHLVLLDGIGLGIAMPRESAEALRASCKRFLRSQLPSEFLQAAAEAAGELAEYPIRHRAGDSGAQWGIGPFWISATAEPPSRGAGFQFAARTVAANAMRLLRALQLPKAVLLEGSPGVGKTSLVAALAQATGRQLVRINLSEQTDMMDLLGADLPAPGGEFAWADGPLLAALKAGHWVLLDELNLANQSVLEGLNALLDHRGEVFVPELGAAFKAPPGFRVFAAQNPLAEGGGRRGLPASFLNRFSRVGVDMLTAADLTAVAVSLHPRLPPALLARMVALLEDLHEAVNVRREFGGIGGPWEFNLRDLLRWCRLVEASAPSSETEEAAVVRYAHILLEQRLRTPSDRQAVQQLMTKHGFQPMQPSKPVFHMGLKTVQLGWATLPRGSAGSSGAASLRLLNGQLPALEAAAHCVQQSWPVLLAGGQGAGKTSVVRVLAALCGRELVELCLTPGTDTSDVLGGFEQAEPRRSLQEAQTRVDQAVSRTAAVLLDSERGEALVNITSLAKLSAAWRALRSTADASRKLERLHAAAAAASEALAEFSGTLGVQAAQEELQAALGALSAVHDTDTRGRFEWVDGAVTRAVERGGWVLLDNANLCNPTVLDRLNPLLEPGGTLLLNEAGTRDGQPRLLTAHPGFRLFLAMDARHGEVSRAMRNRCVEVCLLPPEAPQTPDPAQPQAQEDLLACLTTQGVPGRHLQAAMASAHAATACRLTGQTVTARELGSWAGLAAVLCQQGWDVDTALSTAGRQVYAVPKGCDGAAVEIAAGVSGSAAARPLFTPAAWPLPISMADWTGDSQLAILARDSALLEACMHDLEAAEASSAQLPVPGELGPGLPAGGLQAALTGIAICSTDSASRAQLDDLAHRLWHAAAAFVERTPPGDSAARATWACAALSAEGPAHDAVKAMQEYFRHAALVRGGKQIWWALAASTRLTSECAAVSQLQGLPRGCSLLQLSCWRAVQPKGRMLNKAAHPVLDALYPLLAAVAALQLNLALHPSDPTELAGLQDTWRMLWHLCQASATDLDQFLQPFEYHYQQLRDILRALLPQTGSSEAEAAFRRTQDALLVADAALGLEGPRPPAPLLWLRVGHPSLPASRELVDLERQMHALLDLLACGAPWQEEHDSWPRALSASDVPPLDTDPGDVAAALLASLAGHDQLRGELLTGLCLFRVAAYRTGSGELDTTKAAHVVALLHERVENVVSQVRASTGAPAADLPPTSQSSTLLPWQLMTSGQARMYQAQLLPLRAHAAHVDWLAYLTALTEVAGSTPVISGGAKEAAVRLLGAMQTCTVPGVWMTSLDAPRQQLEWLLLAAESTPEAALEAQVGEHLQCLWTEWHRSSLTAAGPPLSAALTDAAASILAGRAAAVRDGELRGLQLQLAVRSLRRWCTARSNAAIVSAMTVEQRALRWLLCQCLLAFQDTVKAPQRLAAALVAIAEGQAHVLPDLLALLRGSSHGQLVGLLDAVVAPCLEAVFASSQQAGLQHAARGNGRGWLLLGLLRLHLVAPATGFDPATEPELRRAAVLHTRNHWLQPELEVRKQLQQLPGGPDEGPRLHELLAEILGADKLADELLVETVPRPATSQYPALKQEIARFVGGLASVPRVSALLQSLEASEGSAQAEAWRHSAAAFSDRLAAAYPMYRDLWLPIQQALLESRRGLEMLTAAGQPGDSGLLSAATSLAIFPRLEDPGLPRESTIQLVTQHAASLAAFKAQPAAAGSAALEARLKVLKLLLGRTLGAGKSAAASAEPILGELLGVWEALTAAEAEKAEADASLFKTKETRIQNEEEEAEEEYQRLFPDHRAAFAEFERLPDGSEPAPPPGQAEAVSAAGQSLLRGNLLDDVVDMHRRAFAGGEPVPWTEEFEAGYDCAAALLEGLAPLPADVDARLVPAHSLRLAIEAGKLVAARGDEKALDVQRPCPAELRLVREPVTAALARVQELLDDWPENPLLEQLAALCGRLLDLPLLSPVKTAMVGVELLVDRAQIWEQSAAKHVSMAPQLDRLLALTRRWRRLELKSWHSLLDRVLSKSAAGAHGLWFHLLRLLLAPPGDQQPAQIATTLEQFVQSAPLGEFARRLEMLRAFGLHLRALGGDRTTVATLVLNLHEFYSQYSERVAAALKAGLAPVEKHLQDFVKLAKWEDRGHYAQKQETEKSQRQLHKLARDAKDALARPAAGVLAAAAAAGGFADLADPDLDANGEAGAKKRKQPPPPPPGWQDQGAEQVWQALCSEAQASAGKRLPAMDSAQHYRQRMPQLAARLGLVLETAATGRSASHLEGARRLDELAGEAAQRCSDLRQLSGKSARSRKKKALVDFLKALGEVGVSHRRTAIPAEERDVYAWFAQAGPGEDLGHLAEHTTAAFPAAGKAWQRAQTYYLRSIARLQRLWQAAQAPHQDVSGQEVERAVRLSEHLLHLQRKQRGSLAAAAALCGKLGSLDALLSQYDAGSAAAALQSLGAVGQAQARHLLERQQAELARLSRGSRDTVRLLQALAAAEPARPAADALQAAAGSLGKAQAHLDALLAAAQAHAVSDCPAEVVATPAALATAVAARQEMSELSAGLQKEAPVHAEAAPCWAAVVSEIEAAAGQLLEDSHSGGVATGDAGLVEEALEAAVEKLLVWAQGAREPEITGSQDDETEGQERQVLELMAGVEAKIAPSRLQGMATALESLLAVLPLACGPEECTFKWLQQLRALLALCQGALRSLLLQYLELHRATAKLGYIATSIFAGVVQEGFCTAEDAAEDGSGGGEGAFQEAEGTGLGEGEGAKDISDQIEDEDQLLGAKQRDAGDDETAEVPPPDDGAKGVEMDADFEGAMEDVAPNDESDEEADDGDDPERLQQEMGDVGEQGETVDERLWGDEDRPEEGQQGPEKFEKDAPVQVDDKSNLEYQAGAEEDDKEAPKKDPEQGDQQPPPEQAAQDGEGEEGSGQEEEAGEGQEGRVNEDLEENYEDRQFAAPQEPEQELELPDDMELDGDAGGEEDEAGEEEPAQEAEEETGRFPEQPPAPEELPASGPEDTQPGMEGGDEPAAEAMDEDQEHDQGGGDQDPEPEEQPEEGGPEGMEAAGQQGQQDEPKASEQQPEAGPAGLPAAATEAAPTEGTAGDESEQAEQQLGTTPMDTSGAEQQDSQQHQAGAARTSRQGDPQAGSQTERGAEQQQQRRLDESNPHRSLGDAFEKWRAQLNVTTETETAEDDGAAPGEHESQEAEAPPAADEYGFVPEGEARQQGETQTIAAATEEQAAAAELPDLDVAMDTEQPTAAAEEEATTAEAREKLMADAALRPGPEQAPFQLPVEEQVAADEDMEEGRDEDSADAEGAEFAGDREDSYMASLLHKHASLHEPADSDEDDDGMDTEISKEEADAMRARMDEALQRAAEGGISDGDIEHGRRMWVQCEALTTGLAGELTEQLRLLLEPTQASRLAGDFRTGKRISMRKVVAYVASHFRKDKIWLRRTRPDKRQYQVVIAIDDSRSMRENGCGTFAMEAVTLVARALGRLEVGELAVVRFGGAASTAPLHPLDKPFTDADGPRVLSCLRFDQDNTIADRPVVELVTGLSHMLETARHRTAAGSLAPPPLHQLVLVVSDGRFHEKESLRRAVAEASGKKGVLWAFIALDNPRNSLLDMQTVSFQGGKPAFNRYMDTFPFPFYIVLREIAALPRTLADLLRQWIQLSTS